MNLKLIHGSCDNLKEIYEDLSSQFPKNELKSYNAFRTLLDNNIYRLFLCNNGINNIGYVIFIEHNRYIWLDYIAVKKEYHSKGYGSKIFNTLKEKFKNQIKGCFLEVEKPDSNNKNTIRRIKFYENLGAKLILSDYLYPAENGSLRMDLYFISFKNSFIPKPFDIKQIIGFIFNSVHYDIIDKQKIFNEICLKIDAIKTPYKADNKTI